MANLAAGPARTSRLSLTRELYFVFRDLWAAWVCIGCAWRDVCWWGSHPLFEPGPREVEVSSQGLLGKSSEKPEAAQRPHTKEITEGCRKRRASKAAALLPRDSSDRRNSTYEVGGLLPSPGAATPGC